MKRLVQALTWASTSLSVAEAAANLLTPPSFPPYSYVGCYLDVLGTVPTGDSNGGLLGGGTGGLLGGGTGGLLGGGGVASLLPGSGTESGLVGGILGTPRRILDGPNITSTALTYQTCATFCQGFLFFGVEGGNFCQCGNTLPPTTIIPPVVRVPDLLCDVACSGDLNLVCGALNLLTIFAAPGAVVPTSSIPNV